MTKLGKKLVTAIDGICELLASLQAEEPDEKITMKAATKNLDEFYNKISRAYHSEVNLIVGAGMAYARLLPPSNEPVIGDIDLDLVLKSKQDMMALVLWAGSATTKILRPGAYLYQCGRISVHISMERAFRKKGVSFFTKEELLALYRALNRPKDQEKIKVLTELP